MGTKNRGRDSRWHWGRWLTLFLLGLAATVGGIAWNQGAFHLRGDDRASTPAAPLPANAVACGSGEVDVDGGLLPLSPPIQGLIQTVDVSDGQRVTKDQPLLRLDPGLANTQVGQAKANLRAAQVRLEQAQQAVKDQALLVELADKAIAIAQAQVDAQGRRIAELERIGSLANQAELAIARDQARGLQASVAAETLRKQQLSNQEPKKAVRLAEANRAAAAQALAQARKQLAYCTLKAPVDGVILRVAARQGQAWTAAQREPAIWFLPNKPWIVRCEIEQQFASRVADGLPCDIYDDRVDTPQWQGKVQSCSPWIAPRRSFTDDPLLRRDVRTMECIVSVQGDQPILRAGQRVRVVIREPDGGQP